MGHNYHGISAVGKHFGVGMDGRRFIEVPFIAHTLEVVADTHVLVLAPSLSIVDIYDRTPDVFGTSSPSGPPGWYRDEAERQAFSGAKIEPGWYLVRKEALPRTHKFSWEGGKSAVKYPYFIPNANLVAYAYAIHDLETGEKLFRRHDVAVNDTSARGGRLNLGYGYDWNGPGSGGLHIGAGFGPKGTGVAVARTGKKEK